MDWVKFNIFLSVLTVVVFVLSFLGVVAVPVVIKVCLVGALAGGELYGMV